ncbi:hypothetical protein LCGC14_1092100 [marine sediment metagenome]|uniref:Uncharacterized protein n=1 Tax=marine sediment metagenome TaxID=412755 RepID=A0A0F9PV83_9ZZZZ
MSEHTPTPYTVHCQGEKEFVWIIGPEPDSHFIVKMLGGSPVSGHGIPQPITHSEQLANAIFFVNACNNYQSLLEACKAAQGQIDYEQCTDASVLLEEAIAKAEAGQAKEPT